MEEHAFLVAFFEPEKAVPDMWGRFESDIIRQIKFRLIHLHLSISAFTIKSRGTFLRSFDLFFPSL